MYIDLKNCLASEIPIIDLDGIKKWDPIEKNYFSWNDNIYYAKMSNLNEFIGEELANEINLKTICFEVFKNVNGEIFIASKSFKKSNCIYYSPIDLEKMFPIFNRFDHLKRLCQDVDNYISLLDNIFKMFSIDIYMGQWDRLSNIQFEQFDTGYTDLAPLYDYTGSGWLDSIEYNTPFYNFMSEDAYLEFYTKFPKFLENLKRIQKISMSTVFENIENNKRIILPDKMKDIYLKREEITQKKLEKIIK